MPKFSRPLTLARLNDLTLGSFIHLPTSETLDHLVRYLGTWSGSDKLFMIIQYAVKVLIPLYSLRAKVQYHSGLRRNPTSRAAQYFAKLGNVIGDSRVLWRMWSILPIMRWLSTLERGPAPTREILTIERLQGWTMLVYYPLEHLYYLCSHGIIPESIPNIMSLFSSKAKSIKLNANRLAMWSCRFWALYVVLQLAHLREDRKLLKTCERTIRKAKGVTSNAAEKEELRQRWDAFWNEVVVNLAYLPLTVHWSLERGLFSNDFWVGILGLTAALASFRNGWKATALPFTDPTADRDDAQREGTSIVLESIPPQSGYTT